MNKGFFNLSGGINGKTSPLIIKDTECELVLNYSLDTIGSLTKRLGYAQYASQPVANKTCNGLYQFVDTSSTKDTQLYSANVSGDATATIYYNNAGTWTNSKTGLTANKKIRFFTFLDYVFYLNGADVMGSSADPTAPTWGTTNCPATITPNFGAVFQDRCYAANGGVSTASRVWFSSLPSGTITWTTASDYFDINPDDGDEITGLENNGNRLLIFKNRAMYRWTYGQTEPDRIIGVGTSSQESVKTNFDLGITFFANPRGIYAYTSGRPKLISRKIQKFVDAVSDWTNVFGETDYDHYYLFVGNITVDGRTYSNTMLVYNISLDAWTIYTFNNQITWMARLMPTSPVEGIYFGATDGKTYQFLSGTSDATVGINGEIMTKEYLISFPEFSKLENIYVVSQQRVNTKVHYQLNRKGDFHPLNDLTDRFHKFRVGKDDECRTIRLRITDSSTNTSIIEGFNFESTPLVKKEKK